MKKTVIVVSAIFALVVAGRAIAEEGHSGHMHDHGKMMQSEGGHSGHADAKAAAPAYKCPHHPDVTSATPAKCPKCGMEMASMDKYGLKYRCPMHKDVVSDKPGKCEKCKMSLERVQEQSLGIKK